MTATDFEAPPEDGDRARHRLDRRDGGATRRRRPGRARAPSPISMPTGSTCSASPAELQALVEAVVVPETWFFRDREAFAALARVGARTLVGTARAHGRSVPPAQPAVLHRRGAVLLAMALRDAGVPARPLPHRCRRHQRAGVAHARARHLRPNSFRGQDLAFRDRHFAATGDGYSSPTTVRGLVRFSARQPVRAGLGRATAPTTSSSAATS